MGVAQLVELWLVVPVVVGSSPIAHPNEKVLMKFSLKKKNKTESSLDITVSSEDIEKKVSSKLSSTQKSAKIKGFRKGKAPMNIVSKMYGPEIRQDVIYDSVTSLFYSQVQDKGLKPVGRPNLLPQNIEEGKDIKFRATFETYT